MTLPEMTLRAAAVVPPDGVAGGGIVDQNAVVAVAEVSGAGVVGADEVALDLVAAGAGDLDAGGSCCRR